MLDFEPALGQLKPLPWREVPTGAKAAGTGHGRCETRSVKTCGIDPIGTRFGSRWQWCDWSVERAAGRPRGHGRPAVSGDFASVGDHGEPIGDDENAGAPSEGDPDFAADRLLLQ